MGDDVGREAMEPARSPRSGRRDHRRWKLDDGWYWENVVESAAFLVRKGDLAVETLGAVVQLDFVTIFTSSTTPCLDCGMPANSRRSQQRKVLGGRRGASITCTDAEARLLTTENLARAEISERYSQPRSTTRRRSPQVR